MRYTAPAFYGGLVNDRAKAVAAIVEDLEIARGSAELAFLLRDMIRHRSPMATVAADFLWFCLRAHRDTAVIHLWKVFDTQRGARSLPWFIRQHSVRDAAVQKVDLARLSVKSEDVKRLMRLRHQVFAHRGSEQASTRVMDILDSNNLSETEFLDLVTEATRILRRHHGRHLPRQLMHRSGEAADQIIDIDVYLTGTYRGILGLTRPSPLVDGDVKARG